MRSLFKKIIVNNKGSGILEVLISSLITLGIFTALMSAFLNLDKSIQNIDQTSVSQKIVVYMVQSMLSHSKSYQFYPKDTTGFAGLSSSSITEIEKEKIYKVLAFSINVDGQLVSAEDCTSCSRRLGVHLSPSGVARGIFKVWILGIEQDFRQASASSELEPDPLPLTPPPENKAPAPTENFHYRIFFNEKMLIPLI